MKSSLLQQIILYNYRYLLGYGVLIGLTAYSMFWRLGTLLPGLHSSEIQQATLSTDLRALVDNPLDPLYRILQWLSFQISPDPLVATRLAGAIFGAASVYMLYRVLTIKFSPRIAIVSSIVFSMSSWLLSYARFGHPAISTIFLILILIFVAFKAYEDRTLARFLLVAVVLALGMYHRWFIYFALTGALVGLPAIRELNRHIKHRTKIIVISVFVALMLPLIIASVRDPDILKTLLNIPETMPNVGEILGNAQTTMAHIFWEANPFPALYLGSVPMLDIFSAAMVALGLYHLDHEISKTLSRFVLAGFAVGLLVLTMNPDPFAFAILVPFIYILLAAGFIMLVGQWNEIFPKNPLARTVAFIPLTILILTVVAYHNERFFLAWPRTPEVIQQYPESIGRLNAYVKTAGENVVVIGTPKEESTYEIVIRTYDDVQFITTDTEVDIFSAKTAIVTPDAEPLLSESLREQLPSQKRQLSSSSTFEPTLFVVYTME